MRIGVVGWSDPATPKPPREVESRRGTGPCQGARFCIDRCPAVNPMALASYEVIIMMNDQIIDWIGMSGRTYRYWFSSFSNSFKNEGGNYTFVKRLANGKYLPVYIGQADKSKISRSQP
jgi:hypothetical protein